MIPYVRQNQIYSYIKMKQIAYIEDILELTKVSLPTVRRDLKKLEEEGKIILLNGGGVRPNEEAEHSVVARLEMNSEEKYLICSTAAKLLEDNEFLYLGPGTTETYLIGFLSGKHITVVTNGIFHLSKLLEYNVKTIVIGGALDNNYGITHGPDVYEKIEKMNFSTCIIGASAVSNQGISSFDQDVSVINQLALRRAKKRILIADSTKFSAFSHYEFANVDDFDYIITTEKAGLDATKMKNLVIAQPSDL
ncbi:DeoR/GlpR family DNA-binding transcription regulator [Sphaerochaeta halotolerans]|jgi:DeoR family fructose operon transcriptional repressor|uniref:DeoR/GlpR family DNA-binding transcription regulator n=1 Tax=Sphaerochaeta halotolerans TaxID=2293840 RepID=UPI001369DBA9|nr:DeoR/GlpR family DNA-binding transcription regulator [Sphaerochaeta halotolerans]MBG0766777.1 DeoR/GlpR transcriptional regulator [Spirochaetaceae bacterium]MDK2859736.1 DeoR family transcriptional regulator, fructose operon transcriptional repressor [Sphaerochaeta sp.]MDN5334207.1 DeoR family transcriptional regulator, fructose operon transcriptional repressor [Sphaerochaeta sp.]MXI85883.1 DeoR family transcriptional regulator [Sphaerochaeta halotolerans]